MSSIYNKGFYKNAGGLVRPTTRDELVEEINIRIHRSQFNLNDIDTSRITNMNSLFSGFNQNVDISCWDVSNVRDMTYMFYNCTNFNCDLSRWDVSNVTNMTSMFHNCYNFNSDLSKWNTGNVTCMISMFHKCAKFNSDLSEWDVSNVEDISLMFFGCIKFNSDLSKWDVSKLQYMINTFHNSGMLILPKWLYK